MRLSHTEKERKFTTVQCNERGYIKKQVHTSTERSQQESLMKFPGLHIFQVVKHLQVLGQCDFCLLFPGYESSYNRDLCIEIYKSTT